MKYKRLSNEELADLEKEFVTFLSSAQVTADDWVKMKENQPDNAEEMIEVFSDMVFDKAMKKIEYIEHKSEKHLMVFRFDKEEAQLIGLKAKGESDINLNDDNLVWDESLVNHVNLIKQSKAYSKEREVELFEMLQKGCVVSDKELFTTLMSIA